MKTAFNVQELENIISKMNDEMKSATNAEKAELRRSISYFKRELSFAIREQAKASKVAKVASFG